MAEYGIKKVQLHDDLIAELEGGKLSHLSKSYRTATGNNPEVNPVLEIESIVYNSIPSAGKIGYSHIGDSTGWNNFTLNESTEKVEPFTAYGANLYYPGWGVIQLESYKSINGDRNAGVMSLEIITDSKLLALGTVGGGLPIKLIINDRYVEPIPGITSHGFQDVFINLQGLEGTIHKIQVLLAQDGVVTGLKIPKKNSVFKTSPKPVIAVFSDSLGLSVNGDDGNGAFPKKLEHLLGCETRSFSLGASGYVDSFVPESFINRIPLANNALIIADLKPDLVVFAGGINDYDNSFFQQAVEDTIISAKATFKTDVIVLGSFAGATIESQTVKMAIEDKIKQAAINQNAIFIPVMTDINGAWIKGDGTVENPTNNGTSDLFFNQSDLTHWNSYGHSVIAKKIAISIINHFNL